MVRFRVQPDRIEIKICVLSRPNQFILKSVLLYCSLQFSWPIALQYKFSYQRFFLARQYSSSRELLDFVENFDAGPSHDSPNTPAPTTASSLSEVRLGGIFNDLPGHHYSQLRVSSRNVGEGAFQTGLVSCALQREYVPSKQSRSSHRKRRRLWPFPACSTSGYWRS